MFSCKHKFTTFILRVIFFCSLISSSALATTAFPGFIEFKLNNGGMIRLKAKGDETLSWYETANGNIYVTHNNDLYYGMLDGDNRLIASPYSMNEGAPEGFVIINIGDPTVRDAIVDQMDEAHGHEHSHDHSHDEPLEPTASLSFSPLISSSLTQSSASASNTSSSSVANPLGITVQRSRTLLTIAISFDDVQIEGSRDFWVNQIYQTTNQFFQDASKGLFEYLPANETEGVANDGLVNVRLNRNHPDSGRGSDASVLRDALAAADDFIDFTQYDTDNSGNLTTQEINILFVFAGFETAISGEFAGPDVWAHVSSLNLGTQRLDGLRFSGRYARMGETHVDHLATFGIIAHELGHLSFGWPDLYDRTTTRNDGNNSLGNWCLMASGSWNRLSGEDSGATPALPNPILRHMNGWELTEMTSGDHVLSPLLEGGHAIKINTEDSGHYLFLESKKLQGYDAALPLSEPGMIIWKFRVTGSNSTRDNNTGTVLFPNYEVMSNRPNSEGTPGIFVRFGESIWPTPGGVNNVGTSTEPNLSIRSGLQSDTVFQQVWDLSNITLLADDNVGFTSSKETNAAPIVFLETPLSGFINESVTFDASRTRDQDGAIVEYRWEGPWGLIVTTTPTFDHAFTELGTFNITMTAVDNEGSTNSVTDSIIIVDPTTPPVAVIGDIANTTINLADSVSFLGINSFDPKPNSNIVSFRWIGPWGDFVGSPFTVQRFLEPGVFTVTLIVTDSLGNTGQDSVEITVIDDGQNLPPVAVTDGDVTIFRNSIHRFSSTRSFDEDGVIVESSWEGPWGTRGGDVFFFNFLEVGVFPITLTVTDNEGATATTVQTITVVEPVLESTFDTMNFRGTANGWVATEMELVSNFTWEIEVFFTGAADDRFKFDVHGDWSLNYGDNNGDGVVDQTGGDIFITEGAGAYFIRFNDQNFTYTVSKINRPLPPTANAGEDITVMLGGAVQFDASASADVDGEIVSYEWSNGLTGVNPTQVFDTAGTFNVTLTVTDDSGLTDTDTVTVEVLDPANFQRTFTQVFARGVFNNWETTSMQIVGDFLWEVDITFASPENMAFKFDINGDWSLNFGDNNNDGIADENGNNIVLNQGAGTYTVRFNDQTRVYSVTKQP